ncbi:MAG TPA: hypothetical protein PLE19_22260 [Planctomycetota bacterium]|nr:hypothetical protein [Planctomycetota bacterium]HRR82442.1 hypothetical protein [Planctomycetota bacterium]HRT95712.1 hypothetical protein [Planctomycetota bacterium]
MKTGSALRALVLFSGVAVLLGILPGCGYFRDRGNDAAEMFDIGLTFSAKPQFAAYTNCPIIFPIGYGEVDGTFVGVGDGKAGVMKHKESSVGLLLWGREEVSWQRFAEADGAEPLNNQATGLLGLATSPENTQVRKPACKHYLHLGWVGLVGNIRWLEIPDAFLGWVLLDPSHDDHEFGGWWFWGGLTPLKAAARKDDATPKTPAAPLKPDRAP